jgi:hypothetical protein
MKRAWILCLAASIGATIFLSGTTARTQEATRVTGTRTKYLDSEADTTQEPGAGTMKMDHSHRFIPTPDGGRIVMQRDIRDTDDSAAVARIRQHIKEITRLFTAGDFRLPPGIMSLHEVPWTDVMAAKRTAISYMARALPRGAEVVISSRAPAAIDAIHRYLEFHEAEHRELDPDRH